MSKCNNHKDKVSNIIYITHFLLVRKRLGENGDALPKIIPLILAIMKSYMESMESEDKNQALIHAYTYWAPGLYFLGLAGSVASLVTLQSSKFSARIYVYLRALALSDLFFLSFAISNCTRTFHDEIRQSYEIKSPWNILWFRILGIISVENIKRLCVLCFKLETIVSY